MGRIITYNRPDGRRAEGYLAEPASDRTAPGIVVIQEWWGLNGQIVGVADKLAAAGYRALVPDLYRGKRAIEANEAEHLMTGLDFGDAARQDVRGAIRYLKESGSAKVGVTGFGMGGALTLLAAVNDSEADAYVVWYGYPPLEHVDASRVKAPLMGHWGIADTVFPIDNVDNLERKLHHAYVKFEFHRYAAKHAFANEMADKYDHAAAEIAWRRTMHFLGDLLDVGVGAAHPPVAAIPDDFDPFAPGLGTSRDDPLADLLAPRPAATPAPETNPGASVPSPSASRPAEAPQTMGGGPSPLSDIAEHFRRWIERGKAWRSRTSSQPPSPIEPGAAPSEPWQVDPLEIFPTTIAPAPSPPPTRAKPPSERPPRFVLLELFARTATKEWARIDPVVGSGAEYTVSLHIGDRPVDPMQVVAGDQAVDERPLPPSRESHTLSIAFTPLWTSERGASVIGQVRTIVLPRRGPSTRASFNFTAPADLARLRARVVVLYENRVLQSLLLHRARPDNAARGAAQPLQLTVENALVRDFGVEGAAPQFAAVLIVNDNPQGVTGLTAIAGHSATFVEPEGLKGMVGDIRRELAKLNVPEGADEDSVVYGLDDARVHQMLYALAMRGAAMAKVLKRYESMKPFLSAQKMQVVDAAAGAYLPVEFIYDGRAPAPGATRCPNAIAALGDFAIHRDCTHNGDEMHYCPAAFWGFSRCIERQPHGDNTGYRFATPEPNSSTLHPLRKSMLAASRKVRAVDLDMPNGLEAVLKQSTGAVVRAHSWKDWRDKVRTEAPSLLILLPHSLESKSVANMPALEINGTSVEWAMMNSAYVLAAPPQNPIVLVLGCSTALPDLEFLDFVREFKANGAALTIGTIATIRGRQTRDFVRELLTELKLAADGNIRSTKYS